MKLQLTILLSLHGILASAQYPEAENNCHVYTDKDSVTTITNYVYGRTGNGSAVYWPYGGRIKILGSNYVKTLAPLINGNTMTPDFQIAGKDLLWVIQHDRAFLLKDEKVIDSFTAKGQIYTSYLVRNGSSVGLWFSYKGNDGYHVAKYAHAALTDYGKPPFDVQQPHWIWEDSDHQLYIGNPSCNCPIGDKGFGSVKRSGVDLGEYYFMGHDRHTGYFIARTIKRPYHLIRIHEDGTIREMPSLQPVVEISNVSDGIFCINLENGMKELKVLKADREDLIASLHHPDMVTCVAEASEGSYYLGSSGSLLRTFEYVKKYPRIFRSQNAANVFSLQQDDRGRIWAGSYDGFLSIIDRDKTTPLPIGGLKISNGGTSLNDKIYLIDGSVSGLIEFNTNGSYRNVTKNMTGFFTYVDTVRGKFYLGTAEKGLWHCDISELKKQEVRWDTVNAEQGLTLPNIVTITKDRKGRLWMGQPSRGIAVYDPATNKARTWLIERNEITFGAMSSFTDSHGTVWLGSRQRGLLYYDDHHKDSVALADIIELRHPLLVHGLTITAIRQWGDWLILGATDKYLALDLKAWHADKRIILRYLNPHEASFTNPTEQNTLLIDKRDSSVWFSTSDMLYQWDFKRWLSLPVDIVQPHIDVRIRERRFTLMEYETADLEPTENSLEVSVWFQTKDNMPRYMSVALLMDDDSLTMPPPSLQTRFNFQNLTSGRYKLVVKVFEQDGSTSTHTYPIIIKKFLWQQWWFWALIAGGLISLAVYLIDLNRRKQLAEEQAKRIIAEAEAVKSEQNRQLTKMQVVSLSNQFRPHFILNALNTIGAQLYDKPQVDAVLGQLGESIGIIFRNAQTGSIAHPLTEEWKLVESIINIKQLEYEHGVTVSILLNDEVVDLHDPFGVGVTNRAGMPKRFDLLVPMGILQIPVENALIHGLRNKEKGERSLTISMNDTSTHVMVTITDNGIGRKAAALISNHRKNGVGTKNLMAVINLLNRYNTERMEFHFEDDVFETNHQRHGTRVVIIIPKTFNYEIG